jgi:hypothetical protein
MKVSTEWSARGALPDQVQLICRRHGNPVSTPVGLPGHDLRPVIPP